MIEVIRSATLTEGAVGQTLFRMTLGMLVGHASMTVFNLTDTFFVSKLGTERLAAMGFVFPVVLFLASLIFGLGTGTSSVISRAIGKGDHHRAQQLTTHALMLAMIMAVIMGGVGQIICRPLLQMLGAKGEVLDLAVSYMRIWFMGVGFMCIPMVGNNAIRATGDAKTPGLIMSSSALLNIAIDPILIFGWGMIPAMGIKGAAVATVLARGFSMIVALYIMHFRKGMLTFERPRMGQLLDSWKQLLLIAVPAGGTYILIPVTIFIITRMVSGYGNEAVAAVGAGGRVDSLAMMVMFSLGGVFMAFVGQNWGAGRFDRVRQAHRRGHQFALIWGGFCMVAIFTLARPIAGIFSEAPKVISDMVLYLRIAPIGYGPVGVAILASSSMNAINKPLRAASIIALRMLGLNLPLAALGGWLMGLGGIFAGIMLGNVIGGTFAWLWIRQTHAELAPSRVEL